jgi:hypothetical protein
MLKEFLVYYDDLTEEAKDRLCQMFRTSVKEENWVGPGAQYLTEIHREVEPIERKIQITYQLTIKIDSDEETLPRDVVDALSVRFDLAEDEMAIVNKEMIEFSDNWEE